MLKIKGNNDNAGTIDLHHSHTPWYNCACCKFSHAYNFIPCSDKWLHYNKHRSQSNTACISSWDQKWRTAECSSRCPRRPVCGRHRDSYTLRHHATWTVGFLHTWPKQSYYLHSWWWWWATALMHSTTLVNSRKLYIVHFNTWAIWFECTLRA